jgi:hypothetical protein
LNAAAYDLDDAPASGEQLAATAGPPARCWDVDRRALVRCEQLSPTVRQRLAREQLAAEREAREAAAERCAQELVCAAVAGWRQALEARPRIVPAVRLQAPVRGVTGDLGAALALLPERRSKAARAAKEGA